MPIPIRISSRSHHILALSSNPCSKQSTPHPLSRPPALPACSLRSPRLKKKADPAWSEDGLEDDVATLSYERALRTHARYRPGDPSDRSLTQSSAVRPVNSYEVISPVDSDEVAASPAKTASSPAINPAAPYDRNLKSASITIRMSVAECDQLRKRAAEAGLTVSAYLRSCTFEAESLRALVKDALAQLQPEAQKKKPPARKRPRLSFFAWLLRLLPRWPTHQRMARA